MTRPEKLEPKYYRPDTFAEITGLSRAKVYLMLRHGEIRRVKVGSATLIPASELDKLGDGDAA